ncbi:very-long-chain 3-oxoacyl-CoA reductase-like [Brevipalpus obovatus]|uniref:very-long-chain 3-oxoacyl-CoA reductase-like n=1 Tax=Brevipalpus obovatus TaxID=246614 RepID=UPI003D9E361D
MNAYVIVGFIAFWYLVIWVLCKVYRVVYRNLIGPQFGLGVKWRLTEDDWAVVTGCTDGIGLEYARQLAAKGYKMLLISRNQAKLDDVKERILAEIPACKKVETLAFDFTSTDYAPIEAKMAELERIDVLVNNVGVSYPYPEYFSKIENWKMIEDLININVTSLTMMSHIALKRMEQQRRGIVINLSSYAGCVPTPLLAVYSASKAYVDYLSRAVAIEYENKGIIVQSVLPAYVATTMSKLKPSYFSPTPKTYVRSALKTVGLESRTFGYLPHKIFGNITENLNFFLPGQDPFSKITFNNLAGVRRRAYKKFNKKLE